MKSIASVVIFFSLTSFTAFAAGAAEPHFKAGVSVGRSSVDGASQTSSNIVGLSNGTPTELPLNGFPFHDHDTAWSAFVGYTANQYVGVELGYQDHGRFDSGFGSFSGASLPTLAIKELYFGATLSYPLPHGFTLTAGAGISRAMFDADGSMLVFIGGIPGDPANPPVRFLPGLPVGGLFGPLPLADPPDETGGYWKVGVNWRFTKSLEAGLSYGVHDLHVQQVRTHGLSLAYLF